MDWMVGTSLEIRDNVFTGRMNGLHAYGEAKAVITRQIADQFEIDLTESYGYANSFSDIPFLNSVGHAIAVNPDNRLAKHALLIVLYILLIILGDDIKHIIDIV